MALSKFSYLRERKHGHLRPEVVLDGFSYDQDENWGGRKGGGKSEPAEFEVMVTQRGNRVVPVTRLQESKPGAAAPAKEVPGRPREVLADVN